MAFSRAAILLLLCIHQVHGARIQPSALVSDKSNHGTHPAGNINERPIIGILTQPGDPAPEGHTYIAASYVKWIEAAGARVVPIMCDASRDQLKESFDVINGLLIPGGGAKLKPGHPFYDAAGTLVQLAIEANDKGDYFPVHGTCLGLETLSIIISGNTSVLSDMEALDAPAPLFYTDEARHSRFLDALPPHVVDNLLNKPLAMENHAHGVLMTSYEENPKLREFFKVLSLSLDKRGLPYISTMEAREYPVYATQWHPEKNAFEWPTFLHIPHSPDAIEVTQEVANFFVSEARKNTHAARDVLEEEDMLIYNWKPEYTGRHMSGEEEQDFMQTYIFDGARERRSHVRGFFAALHQLVKLVRAFNAW